MPFALVSYVYALVSTGTAFSWALLLKILLCMITARNAAMAFNRLIDSDIDAKNPRTANREIPSGKVSKRSAMIFIFVNTLLFVIFAATINRLCGLLSPLALIVLLGYSYTKFFTRWSHLVLGVALGIAPIGSYLAVTGSIAVFPILLSGLVISWVFGFDIIYALQDRDFDRENNLNSIPATTSVKKALIISLFAHVVTIYAIFITGVRYNFGWLYWFGAAIFAIILIIQHLLVTPNRLSRTDFVFGWLNPVGSTVYAICSCLAMLC